MKKKIIKIFIIVIISIILLVIIDSIQAKVLNNKPFIVINKYDRNSYIRYEGFLVDHYHYKKPFNKSNKTYYKWEVRIYIP